MQGELTIIVYRKRGKLTCRFSVHRANGDFWRYVNIAMILLFVIKHVFPL